MAIKNNAAWRYVVKDAISACIDYNTPVPTIALANADLIKVSLTQFIAEKTNSQKEEANRIYEDCFFDVTRGQHTIEKNLSLIRVGEALGVIAMVPILITFIATFFNWVFFAFTVIGISFIMSCYNYISIVKLRKKAIRIWEEALRDSSVESMVDALEQMDVILSRQHDIV